MQRDPDKQAEKATDEDPETATPTGKPDQSAVIAALADLHAAYDDGQISLDDFEVRRDELRDSLPID